MLASLFTFALASLDEPKTPTVRPPAWSKKLEQEVDKAAAGWARKDGPGGVVAVYRNGRLVYAKGFGLADLEQGTPMTPDTVIDIGSVTKHFTSTCLLLLEEEGKLSLDDDVRKWFPDLPDYGAKITIRHLLSHTSGLRDYLTLMALSGWTLSAPLTDEKA
ncbi:MAG: beta-lactamase family protein, partial [Fimbriimonadaceae bacterium]|nr:beta-lactamase family protein [Fimbriimonadaceae bacterium]